MHIGLDGLRVSLSCDDMSCLNKLGAQVLRRHSVEKPNGRTDQGFEGSSILLGDPLSGEDVQLNELSEEFTSFPPFVPQVGVHLFAKPVGESDLQDRVVCGSCHYMILGC